MQCTTIHTAVMSLLPCCYRCYCCLQELSEDQLVHVLTQPKHALCKQYAHLLAMNGARFK
jgi:ATP-dependent protease Clp ATPase subunit